MSVEESEVIRRVSGVLLVDGRGWLLLQQRDGNAPTSPYKWTIPGGGIEPGETPEAAASRELLEETGLTVAGEHLRLFWRGLRPHSSGTGVTEWHIYYAPTRARQEDVVLGEGQDMRFIAPEGVLKLDLAATPTYILPLFLASPEYAQLRQRER